jgi:quercetin dioxygenase-like cupin family protein
MRKDLSGLDGHHGIMSVADVASGAASGKHYHPGDELVYGPEGTGIPEREAHAPLRVGTGEAFSPPFKQVHSFNNASQTDRLRVLVLLTAPKGSPLATAAP